MPEYVSAYTETQMETAFGGIVDIQTAAAAISAEFPDWTSLDTATNIKVGRAYGLTSGALGKPETVKIVAAGTYTADGVLVRNLTASGLQAVSTRQEYASFAEFDADPRGLTSGQYTVPSIGASGRYVTTGQNLTTTAGTKVIVDTSLSPLEAWGAVGDGVTDDAAKINVAIEAVSAAGGGKLICRHSIYGVGSAVVFRSNVSLIGLFIGTTFKALASNTDNVFGEAIPASAQSNVYLKNITVDGNQAAVSYNTRGAGGVTDDAWQNGIRLNQVSNSKFVNVRVQNSVMNGWSVYNICNDNVFEDCWAVDIGKSTLPASGAYSYNGIYFEFGVNRNKTVRFYAKNCKQDGIGQVTNGADNYDNEHIDPLIISCQGDGINLNCTSGANTDWRPVIINPRVLACNTGSAVGIRINPNTAGSSVSYLKIVGATVDSCVNGIITQGTGTINDPIFASISVTNSTSGGFAIGSNVSRAIVTSLNSLNNGSYNWLDNGSGTSYANIVKDTGGIPNYGSATFLGDITRFGDSTVDIAFSLNHSGLANWYVKSYATSGAFAIGNGGSGDVINISTSGDAILGKSGGSLSFYGGAPISKPTVTGSKGGNAALASLMTALSSMGLVVDTTT